MAAVLVAGALHLDVVVDAPHLPARDETVVGSSVAYRFGGKGGNQAVAAARLGAATAMAGRVGRDRFGAQILAALDEAGVDRSRVREGDGASGMSVAIVDAAGDYGAVIVSGANRRIRAEDIDLPPGLRLLLLQNEIPEAVNLALAARVPGEVTVILNAAPARPVAPALLDRADILVVNRVEAAALTGATGPRGALIETRGAEGLVLHRAGRPAVAMPGHPVKAISTHGAGDAFVGALAAALARDEALEAALAYAQGAAALTVATPPDDRAAVTDAAVRAFLAQTARP